MQSREGGSWFPSDVSKMGGAIPDVSKQSLVTGWRGIFSTVKVLVLFFLYVN